MPRTQAQKLTDNTARLSAGATFETALNTFVTATSAYLAAGSGDHRGSRHAVIERVLFRLQQIGVRRASSQVEPSGSQSLAVADIETCYE